MQQKGVFKIDNMQAIITQNHNYIKYILSKLGPLFFDAKPAELITIPHYRTDSTTKLVKIKKYFSNLTKIKHRIFRYKDQGFRVLFYNHDLLNNTLTTKLNLNFLLSRNFPLKYSLQSYLNHLISQIKKGVIPPEIGIFLGYPLKDVLGFIGLPQLKLTKIKGWRVYGDSRVSDKIYNVIKLAKIKMEYLLLNYDYQQILKIMR
ncbi:MAG: DUF3793 family protein [Bacillota bacterium]